MRNILLNILFLSVYNFIVTLGAIFGRNSVNPGNYDPYAQDTRLQNENVLWYGDQRGGNEDEDVFYDVVYDDALCSEGELTSFSYSKYIFLGPIISSEPSDSKESCAKSCYDSAGCKSANFYKTASQFSGGQCELMSMLYSDRPSWLAPLEDGVYMEDIRCSGVSNNEIHAGNQKSSNWKFQSSKVDYYDEWSRLKHPNF